ncbi:MFS transporter [Streptosporangiaceae bacterium NEAU-GS5]|nr:MFS transporter [Streptosporangiaceae bacterium NEAU-GS5]
MARKWWTLAAVVAGVFMLLLDSTIVNIALPSIQGAFHASLTDLQWVIDAYALTLAAALLIGGSLADRFGRRLLFTIGIAVFTGGSLLCGLATGALFLSLARGLQGVGGAVMFAVSLALLGDAFRGKERGVAFGVFGAVTGVAVAVGPVVGGLITTGLSWRWIFLVNVPIGVATAAVTLLKVAESRDTGAARLDVFGFVTFAAGLGALVYGLIESAGGWGQAKVVVSLVAAGVLLAAFVVGEAVQRRPMLDLSLFRKPTFDGGLISSFAMSGSMFSVLTFVIIYLQSALGYDALGSGLRTLFITLAVFVTAAVAGRLTTVVPVRVMISAGFVFVGAGLLLMRGLTPASEWTHLIPGMIVAGIGAGLVNVPLASTAVGVVEPARGGMASGINSTLRQVGLATGIAIYGSLFASHLRTDGFTGSLNLILLIAGVVALAAAVFSGLLIRAKDFVTEPVVTHHHEQEEVLA